jgi:hypothetical protein
VRTASVEADLPWVDAVDVQMSVVPWIPRQGVPNRLVRLGLDRVHDAMSVCKWAPKAMKPASTRLSMKAAWEGQSDCSLSGREPFH